MSVNDIRQRALASLILPPQRLPHLRAHDVAEIDAEARAALTEMLDCPIDHKAGAGRQRRILVDGGAADELRDRLRRDLHCCHDNTKETPIGAADRLDGIASHRPVC